MTDTLIARLRGEVAALRAARQDYDAGHQAVADRAAEYFTEAAAALERAERVVEAARIAVSSSPEDYVRLGGRSRQEFVASALAAYDTTRADKSRTTLRREAAQRGEEVPEFDRKEMLSRDNKSDQHVRGLNAEEEKK